MTEPLNLQQRLAAAEAVCFALRDLDLPLSDEVQVKFAAWRDAWTAAMNIGATDPTLVAPDDVKERLFSLAQMADAIESHSRGAAVGGARVNNVVVLFIGLSVAQHLLGEHLPEPGDDECVAMVALRHHLTAMTEVTKPRGPDVTASGSSLN